MNATMFQTTTGNLSGRVVSSPGFFCFDCKEAFLPGDAVLHQNHYWNSSVKDWREGDCFVECPECSRKERMTIDVPKKHFLRVVQDWGR